VGGDVDDRARAAAGEEAANGGHAAGHRECEVERYQLQQLGRRNVVKRRVAEDGRIVHPAGERSGSLSRIGGATRDGFIAGVAGHSRDLWMLACPRQRLGVHVNDHHLTLCCEPRCDRSTEPAGAAGHDIGAHHAQAILIAGEAGGTPSVSVRKARPKLERSPASGMPSGN
jgi:ribosome modulation factor